MENLKDMSTDHLLDTKQDLEAEANLIEHQLDLAVIDDEDDEKWYSKAKYAMNCKRDQAKHIELIINTRIANMQVQQEINQTVNHQLENYG